MQRALAAGTAADTAAGEPGPLPDPAAGGVRFSARPEAGAPAARPDARDWKPWPEPEPPKTLELLGRRDGEAPVVWEGDRLVVRLAPGGGRNTGPPPPP